MSDATGRFTLLGVPPGEYVLTHANRFLSRAMQQGQPAYWISQPVTVGADDLSDLTVALRPALRVAGRVEFRSGNGPQTAPPRIAGVMFETPFGEPGQVRRGGHERRDAVVLHRRRRRPVHRPALRAGRLVRAIRHAGRQGHHGPRRSTLQADATSLVVTYTDRPSKVSGTVTDARGAASPTAVVLVFPVDPRRWSGYGASPRNSEKRVDDANRRLHVRPPAARRLLRDRDRCRRGRRLAGSGHARGAREPGDEADGRRGRCAKDARSSPEGDPMIGRSRIMPDPRDRVRRGRGGACRGAAQQPARDNAARRGRYRVDLRHGLRRRRGEAAGAPRARDAHERRAHARQVRRRPPTTAARSPFAVCRRAGSSCRRSRTPISEPATARRGRTAPARPSS